MAPDNGPHGLSGSEYKLTFKLFSLQEIHTWSLRRDEKTDIDYGDVPIGQCIALGWDC